MAEAEESLRITQNRYQAGMSNVTDLLRNETAVLESRTRYLAAVHDQHIAATMLDLAAGTAHARFGGIELMRTTLFLLTCLRGLADRLRRQRTATQGGVVATRDRPFRLRPSPPSSGPPSTRPPAPFVPAPPP